MSNEKAPRGASTGFQSQPTPTRYSFMNRGLLREDMTLQEGIRKVRLLRYWSESPRHRDIRDKIEAAGLLLGQRVASDMPGGNLGTYQIPVSSRPIVHDRNVRSSDIFSYDDDKMFFEIGAALGTLANLGEAEPLVLTGHLGDNIALVEFTRADDRKIFFVPGFEDTVYPSPSSLDEIINQYSVRIHDEFGEQFMGSIEHFVQGFQS